MRILLLDACRNDPFSALNKTAGRGLAIVDAKTGAPGTFVSFSTSPGAEAEDGDGADSPYTSALLLAAKEQGLSIEDMFRHVRVSVNKATEGRQTPWDSSSLTDEFSFFPGQGAQGAQSAAGISRPSGTKRSVDEWRRELQGKPVEVANDMIVSDGSGEAYEAFVALFAQPPFGPQARQWLDRHRRMVAWNNAVITNTAAGYHGFLALYPDSDLTATAHRLEDRLRNRPGVAAAVALAVGGSPSAAGSSGGAAAATPNPPVNASLGPTCPCSTPPSPLKKVDLPPKKNVDPDPPKRASAKPPRRARGGDDDIVVYRRSPPPHYYEPEPGPPVGIGIGIGGYGGGGGYRGGGFGRRGGY